MLFTVFPGQRNALSYHANSTLLGTLMNPFAHVSLANTPSRLNFVSIYVYWYFAGMNICASVCAVPGTQRGQMIVWNCGYRQL